MKHLVNITPDKMDTSTSALDTLLQDDTATELIQAIKSWNLRATHDTRKKSPLECHSKSCKNDDRTIRWSSSSQDESTGTNASAITESNSEYTRSPESIKITWDKCVTRTSPIKQVLSIGTTPAFRGNYSSKPSSLTSRLIHEDHHNHVFSAKSPSSSKSKASKETLILSKRCNNKDECQHDTLEDSNSSSLSILRDTAEALGLERHDLHSILPTVEKLVKVIVHHVPLLEHFAYSVCKVVLQEESSFDASFESHVSSESLDPALNHRPIYKAKKKQMTLALDKIEKTWESLNSS